MFFSKIMCKSQNFVRNYGSMLGKIIASPHTLPVEYIKDILWTAMELRQVLKGNNTKLDVIKGAKVLMVMKEPSMYIEIPAIKASEMLNVKLTIVVDPKWDSVGFMSDTLKFFEINSDLVIVQCRFQCNLDTIGDIKIPLFAIQSLRFKILQALADFMTMHMKHKYLQKLKVAWIGPPNRLLNTYLVLGPKMGMNISYCCSFNVNTMQSPALLDDAQRTCSITKSTLEECSTLQTAVTGAHILAASRHGCNDVILSLDILQRAGKDCCIIFDLPRGLNKIEKTLAENDMRCLTWESLQNMKWILAAVMVRLLSDYKPATVMPKF